MNITLIFGPLAFLSIFYTSVQGQKWSLAAAEVGDKSYTLRVSLERKEDGKTYLIHAMPQNSTSNVPEVVHGPFELQGSGPYTMLVNKVWLNTKGGEKYVNVTFSDAATAWEFYRILNPHHSSTFRNSFKIKQLVLDSWEHNPALAFEEMKPKALDIFKLKTSTGADSKARRYVVHNMDGDQEPILIFHSFEYEMKDYIDNLMFSLRPHNIRSRYLFNIQIENPIAIGELLIADAVLKSLGFKDDLQDLEALPINTYPSRTDII